MKLRSRWTVFGETSKASASVLQLTRRADFCASLRCSWMRSIRQSALFFLLAALGGGATEREGGLPEAGRDFIPPS